MKAATTEKAVTVPIRKRRMLKSPIPVRTSPLHKATDGFRVPPVPWQCAGFAALGGRMSRFHCIAAVAAAGAGRAGGCRQKAHAVARLKDLDGKPVGTVDFAAVNRGVLITFDLHDLPPGRACHPPAHSGNCDAKTGFTAAGPILTLIPGKQHGYLAEGGPEAGDLPNQFAGADGQLHASVLANGFGLGNGKRSIFDRDGVAIIVDPAGRRLPHPAPGQCRRPHRLRRGHAHRRAQSHGTKSRIDRRRPAGGKPGTAMTYPATMGLEKPQSLPCAN